MTASALGLWALVAVTGGAGAVARVLLDRAVTRRIPLDFPYGILAVNLSGAALLGFVGALALGDTAGLLIGTAGLGAYTTFSTWMLQTHELARQRRAGAAAANIVLGVTLGFVAVVIGSRLAGLLH